MVSFDPDSNCVEALNVSGYVDVFIDGDFFTRCHFTKSVRLCLVLNSKNEDGVTDVGKTVGSTDLCLVDFKGIQILPSEPGSLPTTGILPGSSSTAHDQPPYRGSEPATMPEVSVAIPPSGSSCSVVDSSHDSATTCRMESDQNHCETRRSQRGLISRLTKDGLGFESHEGIFAKNKENRNVSKTKKQKEPINVHRHMKASGESVSDELKCDICKKTFERRRQMLTHGRNPDCVVSCSVCGKKFLSKAMYFVHFCKRHPDICTKGHFSEVSKVTHPINWCVDGEKARCPVCLKKGKKVKLMDHLETIHFQDPSYICCVCNKSFCSEQEWHQHSRSHREHQDYVSGDDFDTEVEDSLHEYVTKREPQDCREDFEVTEPTGLQSSVKEHNEKALETSYDQPASSTESENFIITVNDVSKEINPVGGQTGEMSYVVTKEEVLESEYSSEENEEEYEHSNGVESDNTDDQVSSGTRHGGTTSCTNNVSLSELTEQPEQSNVNRAERHVRRQARVAGSQRRSRSYQHIHNKKKHAFPCNFCEKNFPTSKDRKAHKLNTNYKVTCTLCGSSHSSKGSLFEHYCRVHSDVQDLREQFGPELSLVNLNILRNQDVCPLCMAPRREENWGKHFDILHFTNPLYLCCVCGQEFTTERLWNDHCRQEHSKSGYVVYNKRRDPRISQFGKRLEKSLSDISFVRASGLSGSHEYQCRFCQKTFSSKLSLLSHLKRKMFLRRASISCKQCKARFKDQASLIAHEKRMHDEGMKESGSVDRSKEKFIDCPICQKVTKNLDLIVHIRQWHTRETLYVCCVCGAGFNSLSAYRNHGVARHTERQGRQDRQDRPGEFRRAGKLFQCAVCKQTFTSGSEFGSHKAMHRKTCIFCGESFPLIKLAQKHYEAMHPEQLHSCNHCDKKFPTLKQLQTHERHIRFHPTEPCPKCGLMFRSLRRHLRTVHSEVQEVQCSVCGKTVKNEARLARHMELHKNDQLPCPECSKVFSNIVALRRHLNVVHFADQYHMCHICGKSFSRKTTLRYHERIHSATKMFSCPLCSQGFNYKVSLLTHMRSKHPGYELTF